MAKDAQDKTQDTSRPQDSGTGRRISRSVSLIVIVVVVVAAFLGGLLLGNSRLRQAEAAWKEERVGLEAQMAAIEEEKAGLITTMESQAVEMSGVKSRELLWRLDAGISTVYIDVLERNFGLARDETAALREALGNASAGLDSETQGRLAPLDTIMADIARDISTLSPEAQVKIREARKLLQGIVREGGD